MDEQLVLQQREAAVQGCGPVWDGVDLSVCWQSRWLDGVLPLVFVALVLLLALFQGASALLSHERRRPSVKVSRAGVGRVQQRATARRTSRSQSRSSASRPAVRPSSSSVPADERQAQISAYGPAAPLEIENEVLLEQLLDESPDLDVHEVARLAGNSGSRKRTRKGDGSSALEDDDDDDEHDRSPVTAATLAKALAGSWKDLVGMGSSSAVLALSALKFAHAAGATRDTLAVATLAAWAVMVALALVKGSLATVWRVKRLRDSLTKQQQHIHHLPRLYNRLELLYIPFLLVWTVVAFFELRSVLIRHGTLLRVHIAILAILAFNFVVEILVPRVSRFEVETAAAQDDQDEGRPPHAPEIGASIFSLTLFSFLDRFMVTNAFPAAFKSPPITMKSIPDLRPDDRSARVLFEYRRSTAWMDESKRSFPLVLKLAWFLRRELLAQQFWAYLRVATIGLPSVFLQQLLAFIESRELEPRPTHVAILFAVGMFVTEIAASFAQAQGLYIGRRVCINMRSVMITSIFTKALRRKDSGGSAKTAPTTPAAADEKDGAEHKEGASTGKVINLMSVDTYKSSEIVAYIHYIWPEFPLTIVVCIALLMRVLGWSAVAGIVVMVLMAPFQALITRLFWLFQKRLLAAADERLTLSSEIISSIRIVKFFAWESKFAERIHDVRERELRVLFGRSMANALGNVAMSSAPIAVAIATFAFHTQVLHRELTAEKAFTALALFNVLRTPLEVFSHMISAIISAFVSFNRIGDFLAEEETAKYANVRPRSAASDPVVGFTSATFTWASIDDALADPTVFKVENLNVNFPQGKLSLIVGPVGSGKSTILLSLLGETNRLSGAAFLPSPIVRATGEDPALLTNTTAYAPQTPWLLSDTIRENIVFGSAFNEQRYEAVLTACALRPDLRVMELADLTEVGERGTVLSGGQKARISLARALYSSAKVVLLDDVLSAVDSHTAQWLYKEVLTGALMRHRTCILVTHAVELTAPGAAFVLSMNAGVVECAGAPGDISLPTVDRVAAPQKDAKKEAEAAAQDLAKPMSDAERKEKEAKFKLIKDEEQQQGSVALKVYWVYIRSLGSAAVIVALLLFAVAQLSQVATSLALRYWAQSYDTHSSMTMLVAAWRAVKATLDGDRHLYWLKVYVGIALLNIVLNGVRIGYFQWRGVVASRAIYNRLLKAILAAPMRFFDTTPTGRILNRMSRDIETIDQELNGSLMFLLIETFASIAIVVSIGAVVPAFFMAGCVIALMYVLIAKVYIASSREAKRYDSTTRSPIFGLFGEVLSGVTSIRAYGDGARFTRILLGQLNDNLRPFWLLWQANRWLSARVDLTGGLVALVSALFVLSAPSMDAGLAGFVLSFAIQFNERMLWFVRLWSQNEINMNSLERAGEYMNLESEPQDGRVPPAIWPSREGSIHVENLTARYAPEYEPVLKNISFEIQPREKVGICGRSGSGKSSLALSFFRFIEPDSGRIMIDGIDINTLKLSELRSRLTIVAQDASIFAGSLRFNLDPFDTFDDAELWDVLYRVGLASPNTPRSTPGPSRVASLARIETISSDDTVGLEADESKYPVKSLEMAVQEGGKNFSAGQRQLVALARGMLKLRQSSLLILDEASASLDAGSDERVQRTIRQEMGDATILCIAHRLKTIIDFDKVLVLGAGEVLEYDAPAKLLEDPKSAFSELCRKSGEYDLLVKMANSAR